MIRLSQLEGRWTIERRITDRRDGRDATFSGTAVFRPDDAGLVYDETGQLEIAGGGVMTAERRYLWRETAPGQIAVLFADGRPFHTLDESGRDTHDCAPDIYRVRYEFGAWPAWSAHWSVTGPRKDYDSFSRYSPCTGAERGAETQPNTAAKTESTP